MCVRVCVRSVAAPARTSAYSFTAISGEAHVVWALFGTKCHVCALVGVVEAQCVCWVVGGSVGGLRAQHGMAQWMLGKPAHCILRNEMFCSPMSSSMSGHSPHRCKIDCAGIPMRVPHANAIRAHMRYCRVARPAAGTHALAITARPSRVPTTLKFSADSCRNFTLLQFFLRPAGRPTPTCSQYWCAPSCETCSTTCCPGCCTLRRGSWGCGQTATTFRPASCCTCELPNHYS